MTRQTWRVLVMVGSPDDRVEVRRLLLQGSDRAYVFAEAATGAAGIRAILDGSVGPLDCVLLDDHLPDMDAVEVLEALVCADGAVSCPIVVVTASGEYEHIRAILRAGAQDYVGKGWMTPDSLTRMVESAVERFALTRRLREREVALRDSEVDLRGALDETRATQEGLTRVLRAACAGTWEYDFTTQRARWSPEMYALYGVAAGVEAPPLEQFVADFIHPDDRERVWSELDAVHRRGGAFAIEFRIVHPEVQERWILTNGVVELGPDGRPTVARGIHQDITARKLAEAALRASEEFSRAVLESSPDCFKVLDSAGRLLMMNSPGRCLMEIDDIAAVIGKVWPEMWPEPARLAAVDAVARARRGEIAHFEGACPTFKGTPKHWEVLVAPVVNPRGTVEKIVAVSRDVTLRNQGEQARREGQHLLKRIIDVSPGVVSIFDFDEQRVVFVNPSVGSIVGYLPDEIMAMGAQCVPILMHPADQLRFAEHQQRVRALSDDEYAELEFRVRDRAGKWHWLQGRDVVFARDAAGVARQSIGVATEITERKRAELALKASELRYRRLFESATYGILILDARTALITEANPFIAELLGYTPEELVGKDLEQIGAFKSRDLLKANGSIRYGDLRLETKTGRRIFVEFVSNIYDEADRTLIQCRIRDITEQKVTEAELRDGEHRMRLATEATGVGIWEWNVITGQIKWDPQMFTIYGTSPTKDGIVPYTTWSEAVRPEDLAREEAILQDTVRRKGRSSREFRIRRRDDGEVRLIKSVETVRQNAEGQAEWVLGTNLDITERKRMEDTLRDQDRRKDEFLATLAHELRNPLAPIRTGLAMLRMGRSPDQVDKTLGMMDRQFGYLVHLVDDLLDIARVSQGKIHLRLERVTLWEVVNAAVEVCRTIIESKGHRLELDLPREPLTMNGDKTRLVQVVANLLTNAAKYSEAGGHICVSARQENAQAIVKVVDTGVGIAPDLLPTLWDLFTQVRDTLDKAQGGLGIGLSLVKKLVEMHGGTVVAESEGVGRGSTFIVRLPLVAPVEPEAPAAPHLVASAPVPGRRILVVDDNVDGAESLAMLLECSGHTTQTAHSGPEALEITKAFRPEVVFLDIGLPEMDGYEVARRLRADADTARVVLVALTGWGSEGDKQKSREAGFDFHLIKPADLALVTKLLEELPASRLA